MELMPLALIITAKILIGLYFVFFGIWNIYHWIPILSVLIRDRIPHPYFIMLIGINLEVIAGFMIMFNFLHQYAALFLLPFNLLSVCLFHPYWQHTGESRKLHFTIFVANLTVISGTLLWLIAI